MAKSRQFIDTAHLTERAKEVCYAYNSGIPVSEIADTLGIAVGTVQQHIARARAKNRKVYEASVGAETTEEAE